MRLVQDDDVIETLSSDRADHALDERILPGTRRRGHDLGDAHGRHAALQGRAVNPVAIAVRPAGCRVVRKGLNHLLRPPLGGRMRRGVQMEDAPSMVGEHDDDEEHPSRERRHGEEAPCASSSKSVASSSKTAGHGPASGADRSPLHRHQLLAQRQVLQDQFSMSTKSQRQRPTDDDQQLEHVPILAGAGARINSEEF